VKSTASGPTACRGNASRVKPRSSPITCTRTRTATHRNNNGNWQTATARNWSSDGRSRRSSNPAAGGPTEHERPESAVPGAGAFEPAFAGHRNPTPSGAARVEAAGAIPAGAWEELHQPGKPYCQEPALTLHV
jgi:hypothetical protein